MLRLTPATCTYYPGQWGFDLVADFPVEYTDGTYITIPAGFWYNAGSIPSAFWQLTFSPYDPRILVPTLPHDYGYTTKCVSRAVADATLTRDLAKWAHGVRPSLVNLAVRCFGSFAWRDTDQDQAYYNHLVKTVIANADYGLARYGLMPQEKLLPR